MKNKNIVLILLPLFLCCCKEETYHNKIASIVEMEFAHSLKDYDMIFIIPGSGCTGCITSAEEFFFENVGNKRNKFVFTNNFSRKNLFLRLKKENLEQKNVLIDDNDIFYLEDYKEKIYPIAIELNDGKILKIYNF